MGYTRLSEAERIKLEVLWARGDTAGEIARQLQRHPATVGRELARNGCYRLLPKVARHPRSATQCGRRGLYGRGYRADWAQRSARGRAHRAISSRLAEDGPLRAAVVAGLAERWSPKQISRRLAREHPGAVDWQVSHETIYQAIYLQGRGDLRAELADQVALRSGRTRRRRRAEPAGAVRSTRPWTTGLHISTRPAEAADRAVPGHWEGDLIIGARNASAIITCVERSTRFVLLGALPDGRSSEAVIPVLSALMATLPQALRRSLTWDNGPELARCAQFTLHTGCPVFFCDPHRPWQRGSNENTNGLLRQYYPKRVTDFRTITQEHLDTVAAQLNGRPRQTLDWQTPAEKLNELLLR